MVEHARMLIHKNDESMVARLQVGGSLVGWVACWWAESMDGWMDRNCAMVAGVPSPHGI